MFKKLGRDREIYKRYVRLLEMKITIPEVKNTLVITD